MFCFVKKSLDYSYIVGGYNDMFEIVPVISRFCGLENETIVNNWLFRPYLEPKFEF